MLLVEGKLDEEKNVLVPTDPLHRFQAFAAKSKLFTALHRQELVIMGKKENIKSNHIKIGLVLKNLTFMLIQ